MAPLLHMYDKWKCAVTLAFLYRTSCAFAPAAVFCLSFTGLSMTLDLVGVLCGLQVLEKLRRETSTFDNQVKALEDALKAKAAEQDQLTISNRETQYAKEVAKQV